MHFPFNCYLLAIGAAGLVTFLSMPLWRKWCERINLVDDPGHRKIHDTPIVLAGGLAVLTGILLPLVAGAGAVQYLIQTTESLRTGFTSSLIGTTPVQLLEYGVAKRLYQLIVVVGGAAAMVALGFLDDKYELSPGIKFGGQLLVAALVAASGIRITLFVESKIFSYLITILWILTVTNAFNFMDNMNGLCSGLGVAASWCFGWSAAEQGQYLVAILSFTICGALLGFLPFNFPKASSFLGDAGSHLVGYLMAVLAILPNFYSELSPRAVAVISPLLILAVPLGDLVWVVVLRTRMGKPFYIGDTNHLSHRLVRRGWNRSEAVMLIWLLALATGALSFLL